MTILRVLSGLLLAGSVASAGGETTTKLEAKTVTGKLVDVCCHFTEEKMAADERKSCSQMCIKQGSPMAVVGDDGSFTLLIANHEDEKAYKDLKKLAFERVEVSGREFIQGGAHVLQVGSAKAAPAGK